MANKKEKKTSKAEEPAAAYKRGGIKIYSSFEDQETQQRQYYLSLTGEERLALMRQYINMAYGMHGYIFNYKPPKRTIRIDSSRAKDKVDLEELQKISNLRNRS